MDTAVGLNDIAHLSDLQGEGGIFEWFLHLFRAEGAEIPTIASRAAVRELCCELGELLVGSVDLSFVTFEDLDSFGLRTGYFGLSPTRRIPAPGVFHQEVTRPNLCGSGKIFGSRKLRDFFAGEVVGSFPD